MSDRSIEGWPTGFCWWDYATNDDKWTCRWTLRLDVNVRMPSVSIVGELSPEFYNRELAIEWAKEDALKFRTHLLGRLGLGDLMEESK